MERRRGRPQLFTQERVGLRLSIILLFCTTIFATENCIASDSSAVFSQIAAVEHLIDQGLLDSALVQLTELHSDPKLAQENRAYLLRLAIIEDQIGLKDRARNLFRQGMRNNDHMDPNSNTGHFANGLGCSFLTTQEYDSSYKYLEIAESEFRSSNDLKSLSGNLCNQAALFIEISEFSKALEIFKEVDTISTDDNSRIANTLNKGVVYLQLDSYDEAFESFMMAYTESDSLGLNQYKMVSLVNLADLHYNFEHYKEAADYYEEYHALKDSLYGAETALKIQQIQSEFELAKQEAITAREQLAFKEQELKNRNLQFTIFGIIAFVVLIAGVLVSWFVRRSAVQKAQTQAILAAREAENKRVTDLFWKEIGLSAKEKKLILQGRELPEHTIPGAIAAAKFLSNQRHNPFLQVGLSEAIDHLLQNLFQKSSCDYTLDSAPVKLNKEGRLFSYRVIEDVLTHVAQRCREGEVHVSFEEKSKELICKIESASLGKGDDLNVRSAEARMSVIKGKIKVKEKEEGTEFKIEFPKSRIGLVPQEA